MKPPDSSLLASLAPAPAAASLPRPARSRLHRLALALAVLALLAALLHLATQLLLDRLVRPRLEAALASHLPGSAPRLGALRYDLWRDRLRCASLSLTLPSGAPLSTGPLSLSGVHWAGLLASQPDPLTLLRHAHFELHALSLTSPSAEYRLHCQHLRLSFPAAEFTARDLSLQPTASDEAFFAADSFRRLRYRLHLASLSLRGIALPELLRGEAYRADSLELHAPRLDTLSNREKPRRPPARPPLMPHEALAALATPLHLGRLTITDGAIHLGARRSPATPPGILAFTHFALTAHALSPATDRPLELHASTRLMDAAPLTVRLTLPPASPSLAFQYSGQLGPMDLTRLNPYLRGAGSFEIKSGLTAGATFAIAVTDSRARGALQGTYEDLQITVLDRTTGDDDTLTTRLATLLANQLRVRPHNTPDLPAPLKTGQIDYTRAPEDTFLQFSWLALKTGLTDLLTL